MKIRKSGLRTISAVIVALMMIATLLPITATAAPVSEANNATVPFTCPAICADAGDEVTLTAFSVQFKTERPQPQTR